MINQYFTDFEIIVNSTDFIIRSEIAKRKINDFLGIIEGEIHFECFVLDILEVIKISDETSMIIVF